MQEFYSVEIVACTACFTGEYAVKPKEVLSTDIHERHLNDRPKDEKKLGE